MATYKIFIEEEFEHEFNELPMAEQERVLKVREQIKENPYVGKPLGYVWFREKHLNGKRLYWLVYDNLNSPLGAIPRAKTRGFYAPRFVRRIQGMEKALHPTR